MNRIFWNRFLFWASVAVMAAFSVRSYAQEAHSLKPQEVSAIKTRVEKAGPVSVWVVTTEFTGSFEDVRKEMQKFQEEWQRQKPLSADSKFKPTGILVLHEDPTGKSAFKMEIGSTVPAGIKVKAPLRVHQIKFPAAVSYTHEGEYEKLADVYHAINDAKPASFPVVMKLLEAPATAEARTSAATASQFRTELIVPLKR
jgi:hypothetical protein